MKEVNADLYKFLDDHECHLFKLENQIRAWVCVSFIWLEDFVEIVGTYPFEEGGMEVRMFEDSLSIDLNEIIEGEGHLLSSYQNCFPEDEWEQYKDEILKEEE